MDTTGKQIEFNNIEAEKIMAAHGSPVSLVSPVNVEGDGVQPHSKGSLYPGVITVVDHYTDHGTFEYRRYLAQWKNEGSASFRHREQAEAWIVQKKNAVALEAEWLPKGATTGRTSGNAPAALAA